MHNFLIYPSRLNSRRGFKKMGFPSDVQRGDLVPLDPMTGLPAQVFRAEELNACALLCGAVFVPPKSLHGRIARSVARTMLYYPCLAEVIDARVLDARTLILWHHAAPVSPWELQLEALVHGRQGLENPIVRDPGLLWDAVASLGARRSLSLLRDRHFQHFNYARHFE